MTVRAGGPSKGRPKRTERHDVAPEINSIDLVAVELDQSLLIGELLGAGTDGKKRDIDDVTEHALAHRAPVLDDVAVERVYGHDRLLSLCKLSLKLPVRLNCHGILALNALLQCRRAPLV